MPKRKPEIVYALRPVHTVVHDTDGAVLFHHTSLARLPDDNRMLSTMITIGGSMVVDEDPSSRKRPKKRHKRKGKGKGKRR